MTANKEFKRLVRARMRRTGESYTAALRHLRRISTEGPAMPEPVLPEIVWRRVAKLEFAYAVWVPDGWDERPPNPKNSPWETARFGAADDHRRIAIVLRMPIFRSRSATELAESASVSLEGAGFGEFEVTAMPVGGRPGARLDCMRRDAGRVWTVREYMAVTEEASFCLGLGSAVPDEDARLFDEIADRWEVLVA
nr:hypothetical protein [Pseudofrankia sp. DC12]